MQYQMPAPQMSLFSSKRPEDKIHIKKKEVYTLEDRYNFQGLPISIENKAGNYRTGKDGDGHEWKTFMYYDYGYIRNTEAKDGEAVDVYVNKAGRKSNLVHVIHQKKIEEVKQWKNGICPTCHKKHFKCKHAYDEDKVMLGFNYRDDAIKAYGDQYDSPLFLGPVSTYTVDEFKKHLKASWGKKLPYNRLEKAHVVVKSPKGPISLDKLKELASKFGAEIENDLENDLEKSYLGQPGDPRGSFVFLRENLGTIPATSTKKIKNKVTMSTYETPNYIKPTIDVILTRKMEKKMEPYSVKKQNHTYSSDEDYMMNMNSGETRQQYDWRMILESRVVQGSGIWNEGVYMGKGCGKPHGDKKGGGMLTEGEVKAKTDEMYKAHGKDGESKEDYVKRAMSEHMEKQNSMYKSFPSKKITVSRENQVV